MLSNLLHGRLLFKVSPSIGPDFGLWCLSSQCNVISDQIMDLAVDSNNELLLDVL
jgi:hypothetical protein